MQPVSTPVPLPARRGEALDGPPGSFVSSTASSSPLTQTQGMTFHKNGFGGKGTGFLLSILKKYS